jgi:hypothetical protein
VSGVSPAAGRGATSLIKKETLSYCTGCCIGTVGAVFNRDDPGNRGWKSLPPTIDCNLNGFESYEEFHKSSTSGGEAVSLIRYETNQLINYSTFNRVN